MLSLLTLGSPLGRTRIRAERLRRLDITIGDSR